jgi:hypothetical protein
MPVIRAIYLKNQLTCAASRLRAARYGAQGERVGEFEGR